MSREKSNVLSGLAHLLLHILKRGAGKGLHEFGPHNDAVVGASDVPNELPTVWLLNGPLFVAIITCGPICF